MPKTSRAGWDRYILGATLSTLAGCSAILDFSDPIEPAESDAAGIDAAPVDAEPSPPDASPAVCSTFEPNDTIAEASTVTASDVVSAVCGGADTDVFAFALADNEDVSITLSFTGTAGDDLDLRLLNSAGELIVDSIGATNTEQINRTIAMGTALLAGTYHIEVVPTVVASVVDYNINLSITRGD